MATCTISSLIFGECLDAFIKILKDFGGRIPRINMYWDALVLAEEFTQKIGYTLVNEKKINEEDSNQRGAISGIAS